MDLLAEIKARKMAAALATRAACREKAADTAEVVADKKAEQVVKMTGFAFERVWEPHVTMQRASKENGGLEALEFNFQGKPAGRQWLPGDLKRGEPARIFVHLDDGRMASVKCRVHHVVSLEWLASNALPVAHLGASLTAAKDKTLAARIASCAWQREL